MKESLNIVYAGSPEFAAIVLRGLLQSKHKIIAVYTQPDRKAGRGQKLHQSPVKETALENNLPVYQPKSLKDSHEEEILKSLGADVMVVAAYGMLLPAPVLHMMPFGCVNVHPSLLPRWRGAAPIQRTIAAGDSISGVTIMQMEAGLDTGPILLQTQYVLEANETAFSLDQKLAHQSIPLLIEALDSLAAGTLEAQPQNDAQATYAHKITKEEAMLDWLRPAIELEQDIRAFNPWPVAYTTWQNENLRIWEAQALAEEITATPRTLVRAGKEGIDVATGRGLLRLLKLQWPGGKILSAADFFNAKQKLLTLGKSFI